MGAGTPYTNAIENRARDDQGPRTRGGLPTAGEERRVPEIHLDYMFIEGCLQHKVDGVAPRNRHGVRAVSILKEGYPRCLELGSKFGLQISFNKVLEKEVSKRFCGRNVVSHLRFASCAKTRVVEKRLPIGDRFRWAAVREFVFDHVACPHAWKQLLDTSF